MKKSLIFTLAYLLTSSVFSQSNEDYKKTLEFIEVNFNKNTPSLIYDKFEAKYKAQVEKNQFEKMINSLLKEKGIMQSYEFLMEEENGNSYLVEFENASMLVVLNLKEDGTISILEIKEY